MLSWVFGSSCCLHLSVEGLVRPPGALLKSRHQNESKQLPTRQENILTIPGKDDLRPIDPGNPTDQRRDSLTEVLFRKGNEKHSFPNSWYATMFIACSDAFTLTFFWVRKESLALESKPRPTSEPVAPSMNPIQKEVTKKGSKKRKKNPVAAPLNLPPQQLFSTVEIPLGASASVNSIPSASSFYCQDLTPLWSCGSFAAWWRIL